MLKRKEGQIKITIESDYCVHEIITNSSTSTSYKGLHGEDDVKVTIEGEAVDQNYTYRKGEENE